MGPNGKASGTVIEPAGKKHGENANPLKANGLANGHNTPSKGAENGATPNGGTAEDPGKTLRERVQKTSESLTRLKAGHFDVELLKLTGLNKKVERLESEVVTLKKENEELKTELQEVRRLYDALKEEVTAAMTALFSSNALLEALLDVKIDPILNADEPKN